VVPRPWPDCIELLDGRLGLPSMNEVAPHERGS
jgi:hypothetical protein